MVFESSYLMLIYFKNKQLNKSTKANKKKIRFAERKSDDSNNSNASTVVS